MIFKCQYYQADTCGNNWTDGEPWYVQADTLQAVVERYDEPSRKRKPKNRNWTRAVVCRGLGGI